MVTKAKPVQRALAMGRLGVGVVAVVAPAAATRVWVGTGPDRLTRVLGRSLGGRDLALAVGALQAMAADDPAETRRWVRAGALADTTDVLATALCWSSLPHGKRVVVLAASAAAAAVGFVGGKRPAGQ